MPAAVDWLRGAHLAAGRAVQMRPLPRLLAFADDRVAALDDLGVRAAAIAAAGPAWHSWPACPPVQSTRSRRWPRRFVALAAPPMAGVLVTGRVDVALRGRRARRDPAEGRPRARHRARRAGSTSRPSGTADFILRSVHSEPEAEAAVRDGADALVVGTIWPSDAPTAEQRREPDCSSGSFHCGVPTYAIGGVTPARAVEARAAGAWGVAAISALWDAAAPYRAAMDMLKPWMESL